MDVAAMERDLLTGRRRALWRPFMRAVRGYRLIEAGDRIAVCVSGGKDSLLLAAMLRLLHRHYEAPFDLRYVALDPGYPDEARRQAAASLRELDIPCELTATDIFEAASVREKNPCFLCARMRRGVLYRQARALGCNKLALGHHFDDAIETTLMAMLYGGQIQGMPPARRSESCPELTLIRPLYRVREADIIDWQTAWGIAGLRCACPMGRREADSRRLRVKRLIADLAREDPKVPQNLFNSLHTVQLDSMAGWKHRGEAHTFWENVEEE